MAYKYSFQNFNKEVMARSCGTNLSISLKMSVEVAKAIKGKKISNIINYLEKVIVKEAVVPYVRYNAEMAHRRGKGVAAGGYPVNVAKEFLRLIQSASKNASEQEISGDLYLLSASARKGTARYHPGRYAGRKMKSTNLEIVVGPKAKAEAKK